MSNAYNTFPGFQDDGDINAHFQPPTLVEYTGAFADGIPTGMDPTGPDTLPMDIKDSATLAEVDVNTVAYANGDSLLVEATPSAEVRLQELRDKLTAIYDNNGDIGEPAASTAVVESGESVIGLLDSAPLQVPEREPGATEKPERRESAPKFSVRPATLADIDAIVDVDVRAFDSVYREYDTDSDTWRAEMRDKFVGRLQKVGGEWMPVLERDGKVVGVITCCPTSKEPSDFVSWEKTTDDGTLETTYDPNGKNVYVVSLSVLPEGSAAKDMLFINQMGKLLREGYEKGFFESRMPQFRSWATARAAQEGNDIEAYSKPQLDEMAEEYFGLRIDKKDKSVPYDSLLRLYERVGCKLLKVVPDAYLDEPSMNYGVVCVYDGDSLFDGTDLPFRIPQNKLTRWALGRVMQTIGKSQKLSSKVF
jgi:hypothetical protein